MAPSSSEVNFYLQMAQIGASLVSVIAAITFGRVVDHVGLTRHRKEKVQARLQALADQVSTHQKNIQPLLEFATNARAEAYESLATGNSQRWVSTFKNIAADSSGRVDIDNRYDMAQCERTIRNCAVYLQTFLPLRGRYSKRGLIREAARYFHTADEIEAVETPNGQASSILRQDERQVVYEIGPAMLDVVRAMDKFKKLALPKTLIMLVGATVLTSILCIVLPLLFVELTAPQGRPHLLSRAMLSGSSVFVLYALYILAEFYILTRFKWPKV